MASVPGLMAVLAAALVATAHAALPPRPLGECLTPSFSAAGFRNSAFVIAAPTSPVLTTVATKVTIAENFEVEYFDTYKLVRNLRANETYYLVQCGLAAPAGLPADAKVFSIPLVSVSADDANAIAFMKLLGVQDRTTFVSEYAVDPCMMSLGKFGCNKLSTDAAVANDVDGIFTYGDASFGVDPSNPTQIAITAAPDPGVLNRAEWIKFVAAFFNKEDVANTVFDTVTQDYEATKVKAAAAANTDPAARPLVAWSIYFPEVVSADYNSSAYIEISFAAYKQQYALDAGGRALDKAAANASAALEGTYDVDYGFSLSGNLQVYNFAKLPAILRQVMADVDFWIEESLVPNVANKDVTVDTLLNLYNLTQADLTTFKFFQNNQVVRLDAFSNPAELTNWFELGLARPDLVLAELAALLNPSLAGANAQPLILRNLASQPTRSLTADACPIPGCAFTAQAICPLVYTDCNGQVVAATPTQRCSPICSGPVATPPPPSPPMSGSVALPQLLGLALGVAMALLAILA